MNPKEKPSSRQPRTYTPEQQRARATGMARAAAMRGRARRIRRSVAALSAALFSAIFMVVYVQLASGHDPALTANARKASTATSIGVNSSSESSTAAETASSTESSSTESSATESGNTAAAVTTSQS